MKDVIREIGPRLGNGVRRGMGHGGDGTVLSETGFPSNASSTKCAPHYKQGLWYPTTPPDWKPGIALTCQNTSNELLTIKLEHSTFQCVHLMLMAK